VSPTSPIGGVGESDTVDDDQIDFIQSQLDDSYQDYLTEGFDL
jgi:hypothetical protein